MPAKLRNFAWRLARNSVPTEGVRRHRNMTDSSVCPICNSAEDSWKHALIQCPMAKSVWSLVDEELVEHMIACNHTDAKLWLMELQDSMGQEIFVKLIVTLCSIWWVRRKVVHEEQYSFVYPSKRKSSRGPFPRAPPIKRIQILEAGPSPICIEAQKEAYRGHSQPR